MPPTLATSRRWARIARTASPTSLDGGDAISIYASYRSCLMSELVSPIASSTRELVCASACETGSTRSSSSSTPTLKGARATREGCPTTLPGSHVGTARDPAAAVSARLSPGHPRGRAGPAGVARAARRHRPHLHPAHLGVADAERERIGRRAPRLRRVVRPRRPRRRRLLPPHPRGR